MNQVFSVVAWLGLALAALLFAQWPLRELIGAYSREANDLGQIVFALYGAVAISAASKAGVHLAAHASHPSSYCATAMPTTFRRWALALCVLPWAVFVLWASAGSLWQSVVSLEKFPDTFNPGYFLIKCAAGLLTALIIAEALLSLFKWQAKHGSTDER